MIGMWTTAPVHQGPKRAKRNVKTTILYPLFAEFSAISDDNMWKEFFDSASKTKIRGGYVLTENNIFRRRYRNKVYEIDLNGENKFECMIRCIDFLHQFGVISKKDIDKQEEEARKVLEKSDSTHNINSWKELRKKKKKQQPILISMYISRLQERYGLNNEEKNQCLTCINIGLLLKYFGESSVIIVNGFIDEIIGLNFDEKNRIFFIDPSLIKTKKKEVYYDGTIDEETEKCMIVEKGNFYEKWCKLLDELLSKTLSIEKAKIKKPDEVKNDETSYVDKSDKSLDDVTE